MERSEFKALYEVILGRFNGRDDPRPELPGAAGVEFDWRALPDPRLTGATAYAMQATELLCRLGRDDADVLERLWALPSPRPERTARDRPLVSLPHPLDPFVGRNAELQALEQKMQGGRPLWVHGLPGIGKTQLVLRHALATRANYEHLLWVDSGGRVPAMQLIELAEQLGLELPSATSLEQRLAPLFRALNEAGPHLLILDGLEADIDWVMSRSFGQAQLIITSQRRPHRSAVGLELGPLEAGYQRELLAADDHNPAATKQLLEQFQGLTLALALAGHRLSHGLSTSADLLEEVQESGRATWLEHNAQSGAADGFTGLATLVAGALAGLAELGDIGERARTFFLAAGWLGSAGVPLDLLARVGAHERSDDRVLPEDRRAAEMLLVSGLATLDGKRIAVHPVVQDYARRLGGVDSRIAALAALARTVEAVSADASELRALRPIRTPLLEGSSLIEGPEFPYLGRVGLCTVQLLALDGAYTQAESLATELAGRCAAAPDFQQQFLLSEARLRLNRGDLSGARRLAESIVRDAEHSAENLSAVGRAEIHAALADIAEAAGSYREQLQHLRKRRAVMQASGAPLELRLETQLEEANTLARMGRAAEALATAGEVLAAPLPAAHPLRAGASRVVADALRGLGESEAAAWIEASAPETDPIGLQAEVRQAITRGLQALHGGDNVGAADALAAVDKSLSRLEGDRPLLKAEAQLLRGHVLGGRADFDGATEAFEQALALQIRVQGEGSVIAAGTRLSLSTLYELRGDLAGALRQAGQAMASLLSSDRVGHRLTVDAMLRVAELASRANDFMNAARALRNALYLSHGNAHDIPPAVALRAAAEAPTGAIELSPEDLDTLGPDAKNRAREIWERVAKNPGPASRELAALRGAFEPPG